MGTEEASHLHRLTWEWTRCTKTNIHSSSTRWCVFHTATAVPSDVNGPSVIGPPSWISPPTGLRTPSSPCLTDVWTWGSRRDLDELHAPADDAWRTISPRVSASTGAPLLIDIAPAFRSLALGPASDSRGASFLGLFSRPPSRSLSLPCRFLPSIPRPAPISPCLLAPLSLPTCSRLSVNMYTDINPTFSGSRLGEIQSRSFLGSLLLLSTPALSFFLSPLSLWDSVCKTAKMWLPLQLP